MSKRRAEKYNFVQRCKRQTLSLPYFSVILSSFYICRVCTYDLALTQLKAAYTVMDFYIFSETGET